MHKAHTVAQSRAQAGKARLGAGMVDHLAVLDQGADPIGLPPFGHRAGHVAHHLIQPGRGHQNRLDRFATSGFFIQHRHIHVTVAGQSEAARDGGGGHHQHIGHLALGPQFHPLGHAKAVLLIDNGKAKILEHHIFLKDRMGADQNANLTLGKGCQLGGPLAPLVAPRKNLQPDPGGGGQRGEPLIMLAGKNFGWGHHHPLPARFDRDQQRQQADQRLARADIALQQPVHPQRAFHIQRDFTDRAGLGRRRRIG